VSGVLDQEVDEGVMAVELRVHHHGAHHAVDAVAVQHQLLGAQQQLDWTGGDRVVRMQRHDRH
jgi:hypothetical protein